jgi:hypothetical protein
MQKHPIHARKSQRFTVEGDREKAYLLAYVALTTLGSNFAQACYRSGNGEAERSTN